MTVERLIELLKESKEKGTNFFLNLKIRSGEIQRVEKKEEIK